MSSDLLSEVTAAEQAVIEAHRARARAVDRRTRAVWDAKDAGASHTDIARALTRAHIAAGDGKRIGRGRVPGILACPYPEDAVAG